MKFKKFLSILLSVGILFTGIPLPVNAAVSRQVWVIKEGMFPFNSSGSSQNVTQIINIPNLISVTETYIDNGAVNYTVSGSTVTANLSGGSYYSTPVKGTATATENFSFKTTDSTISKNVINNRKVLGILGHTMGSTVSSVTVDSNSNFLKFYLSPRTSNKVQDTSTLSYYDNIEALGSKYSTITLPGKDYSTLPYFSSIVSIETPYNSTGYISSNISSDKKSVTYQFSYGTPTKEIEKDGYGNPIFQKLSERGWVWLTKWFDGSRTWFTTYYIDPNNNKQIIPYDTEIMPGKNFEGSASGDEWGQSINGLITDPYYSDGVRRSFNVSNYLNSDWTYIAGYRLHTSRDNTVYTDTRHPFSVDDGVSTDFYNTYIDTVKYDSSGLNMHMFSDVYFKGDKIIMNKPGGSAEDPRIEQHWQMEYGAAFDILRGRNVYNYKAQTKINYYPYTYNYSGSVTYTYETESTQTGYIYNGYIKAQYWSLETVQDQPPTPPTSINAGASQISWLPSNDDYTPQVNIRYYIYYKDRNNGSWVYLGSTTGTTSLNWTRSSYPTDGYLKITALDDVNQSADGYNDPFTVLRLNGSVDKTNVTQDAVINISATTECSPKAYDVSYSMPYNNSAGSASLNGSLAKDLFIPVDTYNYYATHSATYNWGTGKWATWYYTWVTKAGRDLPAPGYYTSEHKFSPTNLYNNYTDWEMFVNFKWSNPSNLEDGFRFGDRGTFIIPPLVHTYYDTTAYGYKTEKVNRVYNLSIDGADPYAPAYRWLFGWNPLNDGSNDYEWINGEFENYDMWDKPWSLQPTITPKLSRYFAKAMFGLTVQYDITYDPNLPIAVTWDEGRVKLMQPGVLLASGLSSIDFSKVTLWNGVYRDVNRWAETDEFGDPPPDFQFKIRQNGQHTLSRSAWSLDELNTFWYNYLSNVRWEEKQDPNDWQYDGSIDYSEFNNSPVPYLPGYNTWSKSIALPHNIKNGKYVIRLTASNGNNVTMDLPINVNTPIDVTGTVPGTMEQGKSYTAEAYTSQYVDDWGVVMNIFGGDYAMYKSGGFGAYVPGKQKWTCTFTVPASQTPGTYEAASGTFAQARFTAVLPGGDSQNTACSFSVLQPLSSISGVNLTGYTGDVLTVTATTTGFASSAWVEIPGVPSIQLTPSGATANNANTWTGTFAVPFNFPNGTQNIVYRSSNTRGAGLASTNTVTIGTRITVTGSVKKPAYITWASGIPAGEKLDINVNVTTLPDISRIDYSTPWFSGTMPKGTKSGNTTVTNLVTSYRLPSTLADGNYSVHIKVTTVNGKTAEIDLPFTVYTPISITGDDITIPTDEDFRLSAAVTGVTPSMKSIKAYLNGTFQVASGAGLNFVNATESCIIESPHPYVEDYEKTWTIAKPGATKMRVHVSYIESEEEYDYVYIDNNRDGDWDWCASGYYYDFWSDWVDGSELVIGFISDVSVTDNGFLIDKIEYMTDVGGTIVNPEFSLTYDPITGKYVSKNIKLSKTNNTGSYPITYRAETTNGNISTSNKLLTVTTPMLLTSEITPGTIHAGGNITVKAAVNKWVKSVTAALPWGTVELNEAYRTYNGDGTYTYAQTFTVPGTQADNAYNVVFTAYPYNNAPNITVTKPLTVYTPISVTGYDVTAPTDTDFKLSCSVTGAIVAMNSITAYVNGTLTTTGGTLSNPTFTLTYNPITGKYESTTLKLLMTQNAGAYPITYRASTTNGNVSTSGRILNITTPMTLTSSITPSTIYAGGNVVISATVNRWVNTVTVAMPQGTITMDPAFKVSNGDGTYTYTQDVKIPGSTADKVYNVVFSANAFNNAPAVTVTQTLTVSTPVNIVGTSVTTPTDEDFKLAGTVTGSIAAISTVRAQITGTIATSGGTFTNPIYTLTYNSATGKYESATLKLLMTQNIGNYPTTYTVTTTNGNTSNSDMTLTVTTPLDYTPAINPTTVLPGNTVNVSAAVNRWIKDITAALPGGSAALNSINAYSQQYTVPATTPDNSYTVTFTGRGYNNAVNVLKTLVLNVFTPLNITASVNPVTLPASETITIDAWVDTPIAINSVTYALTGSYGGSGNMTYLGKSGTVSHYQAVYTIDARHPDGNFAVNITVTLANTKSGTVSKPITISTPINLDPYINGQNTGCEIFVGQSNTLSAYTTRYPEYLEVDIFGKTYSSSSGQIQVLQTGSQKEWVLILNLPDDEMPPDGYRGVAAYSAFLPSGAYEEAYLEYNVVGIKAYDFNISLINNVDWRGYYFDLENPFIESGRIAGFPKKPDTDIYTDKLPVNMKPHKSGPILNYSVDGHIISFIRAGSGIKGDITVIGEPDNVKFNAIYQTQSGPQIQAIPTEADGPVYSFSWIIPLEANEDSFVYFDIEINKNGRLYGNEKWVDTWIPGNTQRYVIYIKGNVLRDDIIFNQSN